MTEQELQQYLLSKYPKENEECEWKEFKNMKNDFNGKEKDDVISYVSALSNMEGGHLVIGVVDNTLEIVGTNTYNYDRQKAKLRMTDLCANLPSEGLLVEEKGIIALDAKIFYEIIRRLPDNTVTIKTDEKLTATITCEKAKFTIPGKSGEDFAYLPLIEKEESLTISQFTLKEMIRQTIFSIASNETNKLMTGELFEIKNNYLKIVSLDGHRIAIRRMELKIDYADRKVVVPGKTLNEISKILSGEIDDIVNIYFSKNHILFEFDQTIVVSRLIDGEYFRIDQMLSSDYETKIKINKKEFLDCIDRATLLVREGEKKPIIIEITDNSMELRIDSAMGSMNENIDIDKEGKDILIGFNPRFLIDALKVIDDETISIYLVNPKAPCFIRDDEENYTYLILPVNINQNQAR